MKHGVHLVGSVPMNNASEVFETVAAAVGPALRYLPDGETGPRLDWLPWLAPIFSEHPDFELSGETFQVHAGATAFKRYGLKPGVDPQSIRFTQNLPHYGFAMESWKDFQRLKLRPETTLALGLVHYTGGVEGTQLRFAAAQKYVKDFMVGTECGFGRRDPATIPALLEIHAEVAGLR